MSQTVSTEHPCPCHSAARGAKVRCAIEAAAYRLFVERGYADVSIEHVADAAGISRRTVYNKFAGKDQIYRAVFGAALEHLRALAPIVPVHPADVRNLVLVYTDAMSELAAQPAMIDLLRVLVRDANAQPWLAEAYRHRIRTPICDAFECDVRHLIAHGELPERDATRLFEQFHDTIIGLTAFRQLLPFDAGQPRVAADNILRSAVDSLMSEWKAAA